MDYNKRTPLAPVGWLDYLEFDRIGNGWTITLVTNNGKKFDIGHLVHVPKHSANQYHLILEWLNCLPAFDTYKWVIEQVEKHCKKANIRLY